MEHFSPSSHVPSLASKIVSFAVLCLLKEWESYSQLCPLGRSDPCDRADGGTSHSACSFSLGPSSTFPSLILILCVRQNWQKAQGLLVETDVPWAEAGLFWRAALPMHRWSKAGDSNSGWKKSLPRPQGKPCLYSSLPIRIVCLFLN
jgi:hypothetical protein